VTSKIETLTSKTTDLETTVDTSTKTITETNVKIDTISSKTSTLIQQKMDLKHQIKIVSVSEQSKIQEQIDKITTTITESKKEVEELTTTREEAIIEETTARTEISYISE
jgi:flagellar biosynthesis chaperone FliJ